MQERLTVLLTEEQIARICDGVAERLSAPALTVTAHEAAAMIGCSYKTVTRKAEAGFIRPIPNLRPMRFTRDEVNRFLQLDKVNP